MGERKLLSIERWRGIEARLSRQSLPDDALLDARGFVLDSAGKLITEPSWTSVPLNPDGRLAIFDPAHVRIAVCHIGPSAFLDVEGGGWGHILYAAVDVWPEAYPSWWEDEGLPREPATVVIKTDHANLSDQATPWVLAHAWPPPWGTGYFLWIKRFVNYNRCCYFIPYDVFNTLSTAAPPVGGAHALPQTEWLKNGQPDPEGSSPRKAGGVYVDINFHLGKSMPHVGPPHSTSAIGGKWRSAFLGTTCEQQTRPDFWRGRLSDAEDQGGIRVKENLTGGHVRHRWFYPLIGGVHSERLLLAAHVTESVPGRASGRRVQFSQPGAAHDNRDGWLINDFFEVGRTEWGGVEQMLGLPDQLAIAADYGIFSLFGRDPAEWQLTKLNDIASAGGPHTFIRYEDGRVAIVDDMNRIWLGLFPRLRDISQPTHRERGIGMWRGGHTIALGSIPDYIYVSGVRPGPTDVWPQRNPEQGYHRDRERSPYIYNLVAEGWTRSRYLFWHAPDVGRGPSCGVDWTNQFWLFSSPFRDGMNAPDNGVGFAYLDGMTLARANWRPRTTNPDLADVVQFPYWRFGTSHPKRIHQVWVRVSRLYADAPNTNVRWSCSYIPVYPEPRESDWYPMPLLDRYVDTSSWTAVYDIPTDGRLHRLGIPPDLGKEVQAFGLRCEFFGDDNRQGVRIEEVVIEYEVLTEWP